MTGGRPPWNRAHGLHGFVLNRDRNVAKKMVLRALKLGSHVHRTLRFRVEIDSWVIVGVQYQWLRVDIKKC